jgi:hypothetical protein
MGMGVIRSGGSELFMMGEGAKAGNRNAGPRLRIMEAETADVSIDLQRMGITPYKKKPFITNGWQLISLMAIGAILAVWP